jgi:hypothetical protein
MQHVEGNVTKNYGIITNDNGKQMVNFPMKRDLSVIGTLFRHKDIHNVTWRSYDNMQSDKSHIGRSKLLQGKFVIGEVGEVLKQDQTIF